MATRVIPPRILKSPRYNKTITKPLYSAHPLPVSATLSSPSINLTDKPEPSTVTKPPCTTTDSILNFKNVQKLFSNVPTSTLLRTAAILQVSSIEPMVDLGLWVMNSKLMDLKLVQHLISHTFYKHFCGGADYQTACQTVRALNESGLRGMMVYAAEDANENEDCDLNLRGFLDTVEAIRSLPSSSVSFAIVKVTAISPLALLRRVSDLLRWQQKDPSFHLPWKQNTLPIFSESSPLYHTLKKPEPLTIEEERDLQRVHGRILQLCQRCLEINVPLLVDAEHTAVQPAIDYLTYSSAIMHNKDDIPIVFGTIQTYLKDAKERLLLTTKAADKMGIPVGFKLVRGAYMSSERKVASTVGYASPIHSTIQDTHACFNDCTSFLLEKIANGPGGLVLATHNIKSGKLAATKAHGLGLAKVNPKLEFAQLYGMAESLSFGLRNAGFQVSKYMPFGDVDVVMPYLLRRAEENRGLLCASTFDRQLMRMELKRRVEAAVLRN